MPYQEDRCALCLGEIYCGEYYYALEGQMICEHCLEGYARRYFAPCLRRVDAEGNEGL